MVVIKPSAMPNFSSAARRRPGRGSFVVQLALEMNVVLWRGYVLVVVHAEHDV